MTSASFLLLLTTDADPLEVSESALTDTWQQLLAVIEAQDELDAAVLIAAPGQPVVRIEDEMWVLAEHLCFRAVTALSGSSDAHYVYKLTSTDGHVVVLPFGGYLRLLGEEIGAATAPREETLRSLYKCGLRMLDVFERLNRTDHVNRLQPLADEAGAALGV